MKKFYLLHLSVYFYNMFWYIWQNYQVQGFEYSHRLQWEKITRINIYQIGHVEGFVRKTFNREKIILITS
jgi:hypothetical protein